MPSHESLEEMQRLRAATEKAAKAAGALLNDSWQLEAADKDVEKKSAKDLVTALDMKCEKLLVAQLQAALPGSAVLGEEGGVRGDTDAEYRWIVDPLDGTTNFAHGHPLFSVSIGLEQRGVGIVLGVVYIPVVDECFSGIRGGGAFLNDKPIRCSDTESLSESLIATGFPHDRSSRSSLGTNLPFFQAMLMEARAVRRNGSAAVDMCFVACGRQDLYWELTLSPWDVAGAWVIVEEAGGKVTNVRGDELSLDAPTGGVAVLASNNRLHEATLSVMNKTRNNNSE
eukprot:gb/GECH01010551.1/.p1 GENE.gb/GECH01010551.1/~~gb/GECH01010551.1/.p1  ORF type:complete len:284 (+),score=53.09 gb/GECH01010551.1/:1-852(+)